jgi:hypothetical protein
VEWELNLVEAVGVFGRLQGYVCLDELGFYVV